MYRSHNKKIRIENRGAWYELFLIAENAQHMVDRAAHPSHRVSLKEAMELARMAYYIRRTPFNRPEPHHLVFGLISFEKKYYQIVGYVTELWGKRFVVETCHVISDDRVRSWCDRNSELLTFSTRTDEGRIESIRPRRSST